MIRKCKPIIWCCVPRGDEESLQKQTSFLAQKLGICIQIVRYRDEKCINEVVNKIRRNPSFSKKADSIVIIFRLLNAESILRNSYEFVKIFSSISLMHEWLSQKYSTSNFL